MISLSLSLVPHLRVWQRGNNRGALAALEIYLVTAGVDTATWRRRRAADEDIARVRVAVHEPVLEDHLAEELGEKPAPTMHD